MSSGFFPSRVSHASRGAFPGKFVFLTCALSLGPVFMAQAHPLDSPGTVYIDGVPCNGACQSYLAWSRQRLADDAAQARGGSAPARVTNHVANRTFRRAAATPAPRPLVGKTIPIPREAPRALTAELYSGTAKAPADKAPADKAPADRAPADPSLGAAKADQAKADDVKMDGTKTDPAKTGEANTTETRIDQTRADQTKVEVAKVEVAKADGAQVEEAKVDQKADLGKTDVSTAANPSERTIEDQILAATALAEQVTAASGFPANGKIDVAEVADLKTFDLKPSGPSEAAKPADDEKADATASKPSPKLVVLILARPEIKSINDLANKAVAIEHKQSQSREEIRAGIVAAGATMVELRDGTASAIDRLVRGEAPAAILTLASPEAADWFPDIKGFKTFRVPLSPG